MSRSKAIFSQYTACCLSAVIGLFCVLAVPPAYGQTADYAERAEGAGLQIDTQALSADDDWREIAGVEPVTPPEAPRSIFDYLALINWIQLGLFLMAAMVIALIVWLVIRYGGAIQLSFRDTRDAPTGAKNELPEDGQALAEEEAISSLDDVLRISDISVAIGALQRLMLESALSALNASLRKSDTARAALARIPADWPHQAAMAWLVRLTERVRYAGDVLDQEGLTEAVSAMRPVLKSLGRQA